MKKDTANYFSFEFVDNQPVACIITIDNTAYEIADEEFRFMLLQGFQKARINKGQTNLTASKVVST